MSLKDYPPKFICPLKQKGLSDFVSLLFILINFCTLNKKYLKRKKIHVFLTVCFLICCFNIIIHASTSNLNEEKFKKESDL